MAGRGVALAPLCMGPAELIWSSNKSGKSPTWLLTNCSISGETEKTGGREFDPEKSLWNSVAFNSGSFDVCTYQTGGVTTPIDRHVAA